MIRPPTRVPSQPVSHVAPFLHVCDPRARSASLVPTGPGDGTWGRVRRRGQGSGAGEAVCERRHIKCHLPSGDRPHGQISNADCHRRSAWSGHRPRASNTRSCPHWLPSGPAPLGRRLPGPGRFRPRSSSFRTCATCRPSPRRWCPLALAARQRHGGDVGPRFGRAGPPVSVVTLDAIRHRDVGVLGRIVKGDRYLPSGPGCPWEQSHGRPLPPTSPSIARVATTGQVRVVGARWPRGRDRGTGAT